MNPVTLQDKSTSLMVALAFRAIAAERNNEIVAARFLGSCEVRHLAALRMVRIYDLSGTIPDTGGGVPASRVTGETATH